MLAQQRHKDLPALTAWAIGSSAICAKFNLDLTPKKHVRRSQMRYRDEPDVLLANIVEISDAAFLSVIAYELSGVSQSKHAQQRIFFQACMTNHL